MFKNAPLAFAPATIADVLQVGLIFSLYTAYDMMQNKRFICA